MLPVWLWPQAVRSIDFVRAIELLVKDGTAASPNE